MKAICIDNKPRPETPDVEALTKLVEGNEYEIMEVGNKKGGVYVKGIPTTNPNGFAENRFIPISDKDEQVILFHRLEDQVIANLCEELGDERNFIGEDDYH